VTAAQWFLATKSVQEAPKSQNSLLNSLIAGKSGGDGRDQHCNASQPFTASEKLAVWMAERPTIGGLLRFHRPSPDSRVYRIPGQFAESLRALPRISRFWETSLETRFDHHWTRAAGVDFVRFSGRQCLGSGNPYSDCQARRGLSDRSERATKNNAANSYIIEILT
jgi:hypothetical protein